tara:strand:+ start:34 stop:210 length:177 start_codon:yes stop_codon:yes gene_type:complete
MTDTSKYKNISVKHETYGNIDIIRKKIVPNAVISRSQTISILVNEKVKKLNGKTNPGR